MNPGIPTPYKVNLFVLKNISIKLKSQLLYVMFGTTWQGPLVDFYIASGGFVQSKEPRFRHLMKSMPAQGVQPRSTYKEKHGRPMCATTFDI